MIDFDPHDDGFREIQALFVAELPDRAGVIRTSHAVDNKELLKRYAHQLKGAAGGYGFNELTPLAADVERLAEAGDDAPALATAVKRLLAACDAVEMPLGV